MNDLKINPINSVLWYLFALKIFIWRYFMFVHITSSVGFSDNHQIRIIVFYKVDNPNEI